MASIVSDLSFLFCLFIFEIQWHVVAQVGLKLSMETKLASISPSSYVSILRVRMTSMGHCTGKAFLLVSNSFTF